MPVSLDMFRQMNTPSDLVASKIDAVDMATKRSKLAILSHGPSQAEMAEFSMFNPNATERDRLNYAAGVQANNMAALAQDYSLSQVLQDGAIGMADTVSGMVLDSAATAIGVMTNPAAALQMGGALVDQGKQLGQTIADVAGSGNEYRNATGSEATADNAGFKKFESFLKNFDNPLARTGNYIAKNLNQSSAAVSEYLSGLKSEEGQALSKATSEASQSYERERMAQLPDDATSEQIQDATLDVAKNWMSLAQGEGIATSAIESLPYLFAAGKAASAGGKAARAAHLKANPMTVSADSIKTATTRGEMAASTAAVAGLEGAGNSADIYNHLASIAPEVYAENSQPYRDLIAEGNTPEQAIDALARKASVSGGLASGVLAGMANVLTGGVADRALSGLNKVTAGKVASSAASETVEEALQSATGVIASNQAEQKYANDKKDTSEGVIAAAVEGAVVGGLSAGGTVAAATAMQKGAKATDTVVKGVTAIQEQRAANKAQKEAEALVAATAEEEAVPVVKASTPVKQYAPENSPVLTEEAAIQESANVAAAAKETSEHVTENSVVKDFLGKASQAYKDTSVLMAEDRLKTSTRSPQEVMEAIVGTYKLASDLANEAAKILTEDDSLSEPDIAALTKIADGTNPQYAPVNGIQRVMENFSKEETNTFISEQINKYMAKGDSENDATSQAIIDSIGDVVLYSKDYLRNLEPETAAALSKSVSDQGAKDLLALTAAVRGEMAGVYSSNIPKGVAKVIADLFSPTSQWSISTHVDNFLDAISVGDTARAANIYDVRIGYLAKTQGNKRDALEAAIADIPNWGSDKEITWDTSGAFGKGKGNTFTFANTPKGQNSARAMLRTVARETEVLEAINIMAGKVLYPSDAAPKVEAAPAATLENVPKAKPAPKVKAIPATQTTVQSPNTTAAPISTGTAFTKSLSLDNISFTKVINHLRQGLSGQNGVKGTLIRDIVGEAWLADITGEGSAKAVFKEKIAALAPDVQETFESLFDQVLTALGSDLTVEATTPKEYSITVDTPVVSKAVPAEELIQELFDKGLMTQQAVINAGYATTKEEALPLVEKVHGLRKALKAAEDKVEADKVYASKVRQQKVLDKAADELEVKADAMDARIPKLKQRAAIAFSAVPVSDRPAGTIDEQRADINRQMVIPTDITRKAQAQLRSDFIQKRDAYLAIEAAVQEAEDSASDLLSKANAMRSGSVLAYAEDAVIETAEQQVNTLAKVLSKLQSNLAVVAKAVNLPIKPLRNILTGNTESRDSKNKQIAALIKTTAGDATTVFVDKALLNLDALGTRLDARTKLALNTVYSRKVAILPDEHAVHTLINELPEKSHLRGSIESIKDSPIWGGGILDIPAFDENVVIGQYELHEGRQPTQQEISDAREQSYIEAIEYSLGRAVTTEEVAQVLFIREDYNAFKAKVETTISAAMANAGAKSKANWLTKHVLVDGKLPEHLIKSSFLAYAEISDRIGDNDHISNSALNSYTESMNLSAEDSNKLFGKGTFLTDGALAAAVEHHTYVVENSSDFQMLPALNQFLGSVVINALANNPAFTIHPVTLSTNATLIGYKRNKLAASAVSNGNTSLLKEQYGVTQNRLNHIGTPPNTDYSNLPEGQRKMAETSEKYPYYFNAKYLEQLVKGVAPSVPLAKMTPEQLEIVAYRITTQYHKMPTDEQLGQLQDNDAKGQEGKRKGAEREYVLAMQLYQRLYAENKDVSQVPVYISSHFASTGRQIFEGEVNPQSGKIHRTLLRNSFNEEVKVYNSYKDLKSAYNRTKNPMSKAKFDNFILAMGLGLGVKVDKQANSVSITDAFKRMDELDAYLQLHNIKSIEQYLVRFDEPQSTEHIEAVTAFIAHAREPLPIEVDGKTNGPFNANWLYGTGYTTIGESTQLLSTGGLKFDKDATDTHVDGIDIDLYNQMAKEGEIIRDTFLEKLTDDEQYDVIEKFLFLESKTSNIEVSQYSATYKRNLPKAGTTSTVYGGSNAALSNAMIYGAKSGEGLLGRFYSEISKVLAAVNPEVAITDMPEYLALKEWEVVLQSTKKSDPYFALPTTVKGLKELTVTPEQLTNLTRLYKDTLGGVLYKAITSGLKGTIAATADVAASTGTAAALYNAALETVLVHVANKRGIGKGSHSEGLQLSKDDIQRVKKAVSGNMLNIEKATEGTFVKFKTDPNNAVIGASSIPTLSTMQNTLAAEGTAVNKGVNLLASVGVGVTPRVIISTDAEMQRIMTELADSVLGEMYLNVYDAGDFSSTKDVHIRALIANIGATLPLMQTDPLGKISAEMKRVFSDLAKPIKFEGDVVTTDLQTLLNNPSSTVSLELLNTLDSLKASLGEFAERGTFNLINNLANAEEYMSTIVEVMEYHALLGEQSRLAMIKGSNGTKVHQMAGRDGTGIILNTDGTVDWDSIKANLTAAGHTDNRLVDKLAAHPLLKEYDAASKAKMEMYSEETISAAYNALSDSARSIIDERFDTVTDDTPVARSTNTNVAATWLSYFGANKVRTTPTHNTYRLNQNIDLLLGKGKPEYTLEDNTAITLLGGSHWLKNLEVVVESTNNFTPNGVRGTFTITKGKPQIHIYEGTTATEFRQILLHEATHAILHAGLNDIRTAKAAGKNTVNTRLYDAILEEINSINSLVGTGKPLPPVVQRLQDSLLAILTNPVYAEKGIQEYALVQEYAAHIAEDPKAFEDYLHSAVTEKNQIAPLAKLVHSILNKMLKLFNDIFFSGSERGLGKQQISKGMLLQAFIQAVGSTPVPKAKQVDTIVPLESRNSILNKDTQLKQLRSNEHIDSLRELETLVEDSRISKHVLSLGPMERLRYQTNINDKGILTDVALQGLVRKSGLTISESVIAAQTTAMLAYGQGKKYYKRTHMDKLYRAAKEQMKPTDLVPHHLTPSDAAYAAELEIAVELYNTLFNLNDSLRVPRFAALSQVSPQLKAALSKIAVEPKIVNKPDENLFTRLRHALRNALHDIIYKIGGVPTGSADTQLKSLVTELALLKMRKDYGINKAIRVFENRVNQPIQTAGAMATQALKDTVSKITGIPNLRNISVVDTILDYKPTTEDTPAGFWRSALLDVLPRKGDSAEIDRQGDIVKHNVDGARKQVEAATRAVLSGVFATPLTADEHRAVLGLDIKGDIRSLIRAGYTQAQIVEFLTDPAKLTSEVNIVQNQIMAVPATRNIGNYDTARKHLMISEAKALGYRMVNGGSTIGMQYPNATAITMMNGTSYADMHNVSMVNNFLPKVDVLASLSAIQYSSEADRTALAKVYTAEGLRPADENGMSALHSKLAYMDSGLVKRHGSDITARIPKGFVPMLTDPSSQVKVVPLSKASNYPTFDIVRVITVPHSNEKHVVMHDATGGYIPYVGTGFSMIESTVKQQEMGVIRTEDFNIFDGTKRITAYNEATLMGGIKEPTPRKNGGYVPVVNTLGYIVNYKFELPNVELDKYLGVTYDVTETVAAYSGRILEEDIAQDFNKELVNILARQYNTYVRDYGIAAAKRRYVRVSKDSPHKQLSEGWALLPKGIKDYATSAFGEPAVYVQRDDINQVIGYREKSIVNLLKPENYEEHTIMRSAITWLAAIMPNRFTKHLRTVEMGEQELVTAAKDMIVVKSVVVPLNNMLSNLNQLSLRGVPSEFIANRVALATHAKRDFDKRTIELYQLRERIAISTDPTAIANMRKEMVALKAEISTNPLYTLIQKEGLNPAVIEELGDEASRDSIRKTLTDKLLSKLNMSVPDNGLMDIGKEVVITQDSNVYKVLNEALELGDFVAKFVLYEHLTKTERVSESAAIEQVRSEFINYNRAQNATLDYMNKTGMMFFWKYFLRIQAVILNSIKRNPSRALVQVMTLNWLGAPSPYEAWMTSKNFDAATGTGSLLSMASGAHPWLGN